MRDRDTFCSLPWMNLNTTPQGSCKLCCNIVDSELVMRGTGRRSDNMMSHMAVGWGIDDIDSIWNGPHMSSVRDDMLAGRMRRECGDCYHAEDMGMQSPRTEANRRYRHLLPQSPTVRASLPVSLELRLSTRCNLACTTCWAGSSDTVAREQAEQIARSDLSSDHPDYLSMPDWLKVSHIREIDSIDALSTNGRYATSATALDNFSKLAPTLRRLYITGGEPTMDANVHDYLQLLIDNGNTQCHVSFTTNCTLWNEKLMNLVSRFDNVEIQLSIDGHEDENDWIRHHSHWLDVIGNVDRYFSYSNINLIFYSVISAMNVLSLDALLTYLRHTTHRHQKMSIWTPIVLRHPSHLNVGVLPIDCRLAAADRLERRFNRKSHREHPFYYKDGLRRVLTVMRETQHDVVGFGQFVDFVTHTDKVRASMLRSFADQRKIGVEQLADHGFIVPKRWKKVFPALASIIDKAAK